MAIWRKPLQFINVMLANRSPMSVTERGPGRMTYAKKKIKPFPEHDLRGTLQCAGKKHARADCFIRRLMRIHAHPPTHKMEVIFFLSVTWRPAKVASVRPEQTSGTCSSV